MKNDYADLSPDEDFPDTYPPALEQDAQFAKVMTSLGASSVRAVVFDLETHSCRQSWQINEYGECSSDSTEGSGITQFATAMGTIAQLSQTPATDTLIRPLNPRRCAFAWRIDERQVAVVEVRYQLPQASGREQDVGLLRELFLACMQDPSPADAMATPAHAPERLQHPDPAFETVAEGAAPTLADMPAAVRLSPTPRPAAVLRPGLGGQGLALLAMILFCLAAAAMFLLADRQMQSLQEEQRRMQTKADATMSRQLADVLALGDYGEVQLELDTFAELGYFQHAVVINAQRRVVALVGVVQDARIGNLFPADAAATAKAVPLRVRDQPSVGHLMTWAPSAAATEPPASRRSMLITASLLSLAALVNAAWLLARYSRRRGRAAGARP